MMGEGRGQAGSRGGCLKKGGLEPAYKLCTSTFESGFLDETNLKNILHNIWYNSVIEAYETKE